MVGNKVLTDIFRNNQRLVAGQQVITMDPVDWFTQATQQKQMWYYAYLSFSATALYKQLYSNNEYFNHLSPESILD